MQDQIKAETINHLLSEIISQNTLYISQNAKFYFDYDTVIQNLEATLDHMENTLCCERPANLPKDRLWCDHVPRDPSEEMNPYVYDGSMTAEEYEQMHECSKPANEKQHCARDRGAR